MYPQIKSIHHKRLSPWVTLIEREVILSEGKPPELFHVVQSSDYVTILAFTPDGKIPLIKQFRPAVECFTWEFPAGGIEPDETPEEACVRELKEETGLDVISMKSLGSLYHDTARSTNRAYSFVVQASAPPADFVPEVGLTVTYIDRSELTEKIRNGELQLNANLALLALHDMFG
jgi:ADP-ribose pyrophosphatase